MINLLASGLLLVCVVSPTPSPDCVGDTVVSPDIAVGPISTAVPPVLPELIPSLPPVPPILPLPPVIKLPPVLGHPPVTVPVPLPPPFVAAPKPPVYVPVPPPALPAVPPVVRTPVYIPPAAPVPEQPTPTPAPTVRPTVSAPRHIPTSTSLQALKHLGTEALKPPVTVETPEAPKHRQPPFDDSVGGIIGNTVFRFPELGWLFFVLAGLGIIALNQKLDREPEIKRLGRHSSKLK